MKKLLLILIACAALGCKKKNIEVDGITKYSWPLTSATISPAMIINGKSQTDFMKMEAPSACLNHNFMLSFSNNGSYALTSTGPLCDMISFQNATWTKDGNEIKLNDGFGHTDIYILNGNVITNKHVFVQNNVTYTVTYIYHSK